MENFFTCKYCNKQQSTLTLTDDDFFGLSCCENHGYHCDIADLLKAQETEEKNIKSLGAHQFSLNIAKKALSEINEQIENHFAKVRIYLAYLNRRKIKVPKCLRRFIWDPKFLK